MFLSDSGSRPSTVLNRTTDGTPAATVWTNLIVPNCNVFMVLNGHYPGEANRTDPTPTNAACPSRAVHQLESDYQSRVNGGDGWLRYMIFKPSENKIYVYTYSPTLNGGAGQFETDANSQFVLDFNMQGTPFTEIATNTGVNSGGDAQTTWTGRAPNTQYEWYTTVSDGNQTVTGPKWTFTTEAGGVGPAITTQPAASQTIASGATAALSVVATGTAPLTYQWFQGTSGTTTTPVGTNSPNFTTPALTVATNYWVRVSNSFGPQVNSNTAAITIGAGPAITTQPAASQTIASGATAALSVVATGTAPLTYQWFQGTSGTTTTPVGTNSPNFTTPALTVATNYWVRVSNGFGPQVNSNTAAITIGVGAAITTQPAASQTIASGATSALSVVATGTAPLTYQWFQGTSGTTTTPVGTNSPNFTTPALTVATNYWVRVSNTFGPQVNSNTAAITIGAGPAITTQPAASQTIASGATAALSVVATGTAPLTYQWFQGTSGTTTTPVGTNSPNFTTPALTVATNYWVRVSNTFGPQVNSNTAAITIGVGAAITTQPAASQTIASGATAALSVVATGTAPLTYQWFQGTSGTTTTPVGTNSPNFTTPALTVATNYWVRVSNTFGQLNSNTAAITIGVGPAITTQPAASQTIASAATATLSVVATGTAPLTYQWFQGPSGTTTTAVGTNSPNFTTPALTVATDYWVRVTNSFGQMNSNTAAITIAANVAPVAVDDSATTPEDTPLTLTQANLKGNDTDADNTNAQLSITAVSNPTNGTVVLNGNGTVTFTPAANFNGQASFDYTVSDGALNDTGNVLVTVTAVNDAPSATPQTLATSEDTPLNITLAGTDPENQTLTFTVTAPANGTLSGTGANRTFTPAANYNGPASFTFTVNDGTATSAPATVSITVTSVIDPPVANGQSVGTVQGIPVNLTLTASNPDGGAVTFAVQTGPSNGTLSGTAPNLTYTPAPGYFGGDSFTFTASPTSAAATVSISVNPPVSFTPLGVGTHFPTTDAADQGGGPGPRAITPPVVQTGDLVVIVASYRGTATLALSQNGGQVWTSEANTQANGVTVRVFWTQFNGIWSGNPAVTNTTGTAPLTVYSFGVDMAPGMYPEIDVPFLSGNHAGGTVTVPSFTTSAGALALAGWISIDDNTWSAPTTGWSTPGNQAQWRNTNGSDGSIALAFRNMTSAGLTGSVARNQATLGPDNGVYFRMAFKATALTPPTSPGDPANLQASAAVGQVSLTWQDNATNEFAFQIERCATSACTNFAPLVGVGPNVTSFTDTTVANSTTYRYRVRAINSLGASRYSTTADITTPTPPFVFRGVGAHFPTVENADQGGGPGPRAITPPASLQPGDLMVIVASYRGTATLTLSETGGQVWTSETNAQANGQTVRVFWSQFNGFWTANPAVTNTTGTLPLTVYGFAFDMAPGLYPVIDVPFVSGSHAGGTVTVPTFDTNSDGALVLTGWISGDNNTWGAATTGWSTPGGQAQWRNSNGSDSSVAFAYRLMGPAGPTGNIARAQSASGPDNGLYFRLAFRGQEIPSDPPADPSDLQASASVGQVALTWLDHASNEAGFNIERCVGVNCTSFAPHAVVGPNVTSYNDTNVTSTTTYRYQVRAFNLFSPSNYSNIATVATLTPPPATSRPVHVPSGRHALPDRGQHGGRGSGTGRGHTSGDHAGR